MNNRHPSSAPDTDTRPWYRYRWPWILISMPAVSVVLGVILITTAINNPAILVVDDYYAEGRGINQSMALDDAAEQMQMSVNLAVADKRMTLQLTRAGAADTGEDALRLFVYHVTDNTRDAGFVLLPAVNTAGLFELAEPAELAVMLQILDSETSWYLEVRGANNDWRLRQRITTPLTGVSF